MWMRLDSNSWSLKVRRVSYLLDFYNMVTRCFPKLKKNISTKSLKTSIIILRHFVFFLILFLYQVLLVCFNNTNQAFKTVLTRDYYKNVWRQNYPVWGFRPSVRCRADTTIALSLNFSHWKLEMVKKKQKKVKNKVQMSKRALQNIKRWKQQSIKKHPSSY